MLTALPLDALEMAPWVREGAGQDVTGVIHRSDAGSQYTSIRYSSQLADAVRSPRSAASGLLRQR